MPCRNSEHYIGEAIDSVLGQEGTQLELVIQDGASTDSTPKVVRSFDDPRIRLESEPDSGQSEALNRAIARAQGEWILWLNADDMIAPGALAQLGPSLTEPWDLVYGDHAVCDGHGVQINHLPAGPLTAGRVLSGRSLAFSGSIVIRRRLLERVGAFDSDLDYCMDFDWLLRALAQAKALHLPTTIGIYRLHPESKTSTVARSFLREAGRVRSRHSGRSASLRAAAAWGQLTMAADILTRDLRAPVTKRLIERRRRVAAARH